MCISNAVLFSVHPSGRVSKEKEAIVLTALNKTELGSLWLLQSWKLGGGLALYEPSMK